MSPVSRTTMSDRAATGLMTVDLMLEWGVRCECFASNLPVRAESLGFGQVLHSIVGRWWPDDIELGSWMNYVHDDSFRPHADGAYGVATHEAPVSDFPLTSLQLPMLSARAMTVFEELRPRAVPIQVGGHPCFAVQPLLEDGPEGPVLCEEASEGIAMSCGEIVHYHTRMMDPNRVPGQFFTLRPHRPFAETYVTESSWSAPRRQARAVSESPSWCSMATIQSHRQALRLPPCSSAVHGDANWSSSSRRASMPPCARASSRPCESAATV